jgi:hypothetical protein
MPVGVAGWLCTWAALWLPVVEGCGSARQAELQFVGSSRVRTHQVAGARGGDFTVSAVHTEHSAWPPSPHSLALPRPRPLSLGLRCKHLSIDIPIATGPGFAYRTTVVKSPVPARGSYVVNLVMGINDLPPGAVVLCGTATTQSGDVTTYDCGEVENVDGQELATCDSTGTITINGRRDHVTAWADIYTGTGGADVGEFSMNETPVGSVIITH